MATGNGDSYGQAVVYGTKIGSKNREKEAGQTKWPGAGHEIKNGTRKVTLVATKRH